MNSVTPQWHKRAQALLRSSVLHELATHNGVAHALGQAEALLGDWREAGRSLEQYAAVTVKDVKRVAAGWLDPARRSVVTLEPEAATSPRMRSCTEPGGAVRWFYDDGVVCDAQILRSADPIRHTIGPGGGLALENAVVLDVGNAPEGPDRCPSRRLPECTIGRGERRSEERRGRESKGREHSTNAKLHDTLRAPVTPARCSG